MLGVSLSGALLLAVFVQDLLEVLRVGWGLALPHPVWRRALGGDVEEAVPVALLAEVFLRSSLCSFRSSAPLCSSLVAGLSCSSGPFQGSP